MTYEDYRTKTRALFTEYLLKASTEQPNVAECYRMAIKLLGEHDALALQMDPFAEDERKKNP